jgi:enterobactin synthetase component D
MVSGGFFREWGQAGVKLASETLPLSSSARTELALREIALPHELASAVASRQEAYLAGRLCAARTIESAGMKGLCERSAKGLPVWPKGCVGSIAHTQGLAIAVAAPASAARSLGVDVEATIADWERVLKKIGLPEERALPPGFDGPDWAALVFSAKESLFKALHPLAGRHFGFSAARIAPVREREFGWELHEDLGGEWHAGRQGEGAWSRNRGLVFTGIRV